MQCCGWNGRMDWDSNNVMNNTQRIYPCSCHNTSILPLVQDSGFCEASSNDLPIYETVRTSNIRILPTCASQLSDLITKSFCVFNRAAWTTWRAGSSQIMELFLESALVWLSLRYVWSLPPRANHLLKFLFTEMREFTIGTLIYVDLTISYVARSSLLWFCPWAFAKVYTKRTTPKCQSTNDTQTHSVLPYC